MTTDQPRWTNWAGCVLLWLIAAYLLVSLFHWGRLPPGASPPPITALTGGILLGHDTFTHDYPAFWWGWRWVRQTGNLPLWNPSWFCGIPFIASLTFMPYYPPNWLGAILPFPLAFNIQYPLHLVLAAAVMAWVVRRRGMGWWAVALAGVGWGFGGHLATLIGPGHIQKLQTLAWMPLVAWGLAALGGPRPRHALAPLAVGLFMQITAGHLQIIYLTLLAGGLELLAVSRARTTRPQPWPSFSRRFAILLRGALAALGLSAIFWVPVTEFALQSNRGAELGWTDQIRGSLPPEEAVEFALPRLLGDSMAEGRPQYLGRYGASPTSSPERIVSDYVGAGTLLFALLALLLPGRRRRALGFWALAGLGLFLSIGGFWGAVYRMLIQVIPGLSFFRSPSTMMALLAYGLTLAAAIGLEGFHVRLKRSRLRSGLLLGGLLATALVAGGAAFTVWFDLRRPAGASGPFDAAAALKTALGHTALFLALVALLAGLALFFHRRRSRLHRFASLGAMLALALVWTIDLVANAHPFWMAELIGPYHQYMTRHWAEPAWTDSPQPVRHLHIGNELSNRALTLSDYRRGTLIASYSGYHPLGFQRYHQLLEQMGHLNPALLNLFAVNYLILPGEWEESLPAWDPLMEIPDHQLLFNPLNQYLMPVQRIEPIEDWPHILERMSQPGYHPPLVTFLPTSAFGVLVEPDDVQPFRIDARVYPTGPGERLIRYESDSPGLVVIREPSPPGLGGPDWRAWALRPEGREAIIPEEADGFFLLLPVEAGRHDLLLRYDPLSQRLGVHVSLLTLALLALLSGWRLGDRRMRPLARRTGRIDGRALLEEFPNAPPRSAQTGLDVDWNDQF